MVSASQNPSHWNGRNCEMFLSDILGCLGMREVTSSDSTSYYSSQLDGAHAEDGCILLSSCLASQLKRNIWVLCGLCCVHV